MATSSAIAPLRILRKIGYFSPTRGRIAGRQSRARPLWKSKSSRRSHRPGRRRGSHDLRIHRSRRRIHRLAAWLGCPRPTDLLLNIDGHLRKHPMNVTAEARANVARDSVNWFVPEGRGILPQLFSQGTDGHGGRGAEVFKTTDPESAPSASGCKSGSACRAGCRRCFRFRAAP